VFHVLFALDGISRRGEDLKVDEPVYVIAFCMTIDKVVAMLIDAANEIVGDADVERATRPARKDVDVVLSHKRSLPKQDRRA
jgi:hypothetical protein